MSFLDIREKRFAVFGLSNRKSVAWAIGQALEVEGRASFTACATRRAWMSCASCWAGRPTVCCDVEKAADIERAAAELGAAGPLDGFVHSIAFANYSEGFKPFHETKRNDFLQAVQVSAFSLVELARALKPHLTPTASVVTIGISSYVAAPTYGYMSPIKQALDGCVRFLAKSFSADSDVRFNSVNAGPLKTRSSAGIPGYLDNYLYAEKLTPRKRALETREVADVRPSS
jgi:enoyl-[acyl-carrier protein] reductase I